MTQEEKAREVLDRLFLRPYYAANGVSENFLRRYASKKWVGKAEPLTPEALIDEADARVLTGELICFSQGHNHSTVMYKPPAKGHKKEQLGSSLATGSQLF